MDAKQEKIKVRIKDLESYVKNCDSKALRTAYYLGVEETNLIDIRDIAKLIAKFELDCKCLKTSYTDYKII